MYAYAKLLCGRATTRRNAAHRRHGGRWHEHGRRYLSLVKSEKKKNIKNVNGFYQCTFAIPFAWRYGRLEVANCTVMPLEIDISQRAIESLPEGDS